MRVQLKYSARIRTVWIIAAFVIVAFLIASYAVAQRFAKADTPLTIVGSTLVTGNTNTYLSLSQVQLQGDATGDVPIVLKVDSGTLKMTTTTGLTFSGPSTGKSIAFTGSKTNVNNALATLVYRSNDAAANVNFSASIGSADMVYYPGNGHVYEVVTPEQPLDWIQAKAAAEAREFNGAPGYLATITDQDENDYITARMSGDGWFGASDAGSEGDWKWVTGPEAGTSFWSGLGASDGGSSVDGEFSNWADGEPNNAGDEDCAQFYGSGTGWNDLPCGDGTTLASYVVEYGTDQLQPTAPSSTAFTITTTQPAPQTVSVSDCEQFFDRFSDNNEHRYDTINLTQDLDCTGYTLTSPFSSFDYDTYEPIAFEGTFNGNGHTIRHLAIQPAYDPDEETYNPTGLFGYVDGATITNLTVEDVAVQGTECIGTIAGQAYNVTLTDVSVNGAVSKLPDENGEYAGGLIGCLYDETGGSLIEDVSFTGSVVIDDDNIGGIFGRVQLSNTHETRIVNATANAVLDASDDIGGLIGNAEIDNNSVLLIQNGTSNGVDAENAENVGGFIGYAYASQGSIIIDGGTVNGDVTGDSNVGGVIGYAESYDDDALIEIKNITIGRAITGSDGAVGGIVGYLEAGSYDSTVVVIKNVVVGGSIVGESKIGGIFGEAYGYTEDATVPSIYVYQSRVSASVTGSYSYIGGIAGSAYYLKIEQSFATGNAESTYEERVGGLVGYAENSVIVDSYASGNVTAYSRAGGLVGEMSGNGLIANSYARGVISTLDSSVGGIIGLGNTDAESVYWDIQTTTQEDSSVGEGKTTAEMKQRTTYVDWDFADVWAIGAQVNDGYPCLRWTGVCVHDTDTDGVNASVENGAPNSGDGNHDGILDANQSNVTSLVNPVTGKYVTLEVDDSCSLSNVSVLAASDVSKQDAGYVYRNGLVDFTALCGDPGVTVTIKQYYHGVTSTSGLELRKYNPTTQQYKTVVGHDQSLSVQNIGGTNVAVLQYSLTDGGELDTDGVENGTIVDPIGLASSSLGVPNTGAKSAGISGLITLISGVAVLGVAAVLVRRRG